MLRIFSQLQYATILWPLVTPLGANAHGLDGQILDSLGPFGAGLSHPVLGGDHFIAMLSVGLLSAVLGGVHFWRVPAVFVGVMPLGWLLGRSATPFASVELGIALSVLALGLATWVCVRWPSRVSPRMIYLPVVLFAVVHGYAHGQEMPDGQPAVLFVTGFMMGTAAIHVLGLFVADVLAVRQQAMGRVVWAAVAVTSAGLYFVALAIWPLLINI
jgi:urease accessory protein